MIAWAPWALMALSLAPRLDCSKVEAAPSPDPAAARAYLEVGEQELREGKPETAALAFRAALRLDSSSAPARARLEELCRLQGARDEVLERAARAVSEGRPEEAAALLAPRYRAQAPPDPATALLYGIALYERGDDRGAQAALERARASPETEDSATVFLGLLALRSGDADRAAALFDRADRVARGELSRTARDLSVLAQRETRLAVSLQAEGGYDSNVDQLPDPFNAELTSGDLLYGATASALLRPFGERGPYADVGARRRSFLEIRGNDLGWVGGAAGYRFGGGRGGLRVEYAYDAIWLGPALLLSAHQLQADGRMDLGGTRLGALLSMRAEAYRTTETSPYSGPTLDGELSMELGRGGGGEVWLRYRGQGHRSAEESDSWLDHGPGLRALAPFPSGRLVLDVQLSIRTYGAPEPGFGDVPRQYTYLDGAVVVERDLDRQLTLYLSLGGRKAFSNPTALEHARLSGSAGVVFTAGLW